MRILIAGQTYYPALNGQSIFMVNLAEGLAARGHDVLVAVPSNSNRFQQTQRHGVQIAAISSIPLGFLHANVYLTPFPDNSVKRIFKEFRPDIAHIHDHYPLSRSVLKMARREGVKVVGTNHFMPENLTPYIPGSKRFKKGVDWLLWQWMLEPFNRLDTATAPSRTAAAILRGQGLRVPVYPISCGVDLDRFHLLPDLDRSQVRMRFGLDPNRVVFLFVGRVDGEKRLDVLLHALHWMDRDDIQLAIVGEGAARSGLEALAKKLNLGERVRFTGFISETDLPKVLNSADIFSMPSEAELLSIATLEAMSSSRPILAARARALPELIAEGVNGYMFQPGNMRDAARYMALMADHPERWESMGLASLVKVQLHSLENTLKSYETLYDTMSAKSVFSISSTRPRSGRVVRNRVRESADL